jgi:Ca2+-dependent lipid-binding protein
MQPTSGKMKLHIIEAKFTRSTEYFSKMDPYVKLSCGELSYQNFTSQVKDGAGKHPKWNEVWDL